MSAGRKEGGANVEGGVAEQGPDARRWGKASQGARRLDREAKWWRTGPRLPHQTGSNQKALVPSAPHAAPTLPFRGPPGPLPLPTALLPYPPLQKRKLYDFPPCLLSPHFHTKFPRIYLPSSALPFRVCVPVPDSPTIQWLPRPIRRITRNSTLV